MKELQIILAFLTGFGELILALYFWRTNNKNDIRKSMALLSLFTGLWVFVTTSHAYATNKDLALTLDKITYIFGALLLTALLQFAIQFPIASIRLDRFHYVLLYVPVIIFSFISLSSNALITDYISSASQPGTWVGGEIYWVYNVYLFVLYLSVIIFLLKKYVKLDGVIKRNTNIVIWSIILGGLPAVVADVIIPLLKNQGSNPLIGSFSTLIWLGITSYIVLKK